MLDLPILNVRLGACSADWQQMTPTAQGRHCAACQREVIDFTSGTAADLEAAQAAAPDGRVCGRFRAAQLAPPPRLRPKLRRFLVALVLLCGLGLSRQQAWAQLVSRLATFDSTAYRAMPATKAPGHLPISATDPILGCVLDPMPVFIGEGNKRGTEALMEFITNNIRYPEEANTVGQIWTEFIVDKKGRVRDVKVLKGVHPTLDAEAIRVVRLLDGKFIPVSADVRHTLPITFARQ